MHVCRSNQIYTLYLVQNVSIFCKSICKIDLLNDIYTVFRLASAKGSRDIERTILFQRPPFDLDLGLYDLKSNRGHLLSRGIHFTKFATFTQMGQKILSTLCFVCRPTDRCKTIWPLFIKGGIKSLQTEDR